DDLAVQDPLARRPQLDLGAPLEHVPRLVLDLVKLEAERLARPEEERLADVVLGLRPDHLVTPRLLDPFRLERELVEPSEVRRRQVIVPGHEPREPTTMRLRGPPRVPGEVLARHPQVLGS